MVNTAKENSKHAENKRLEDLLEYYESLPSSDTREYELKVTELVKKCDEEMVKDATEILRGSHRDEVRFAAFHTIAGYLRRYGDLSKLKDLLYRYQWEFRGIPMYLHLLAMYLKMEDTEKSILKAIDLSKDALEELKGHIGITHSYAEAVASAMECEYGIEDGEFDQAKEVMIRLLREEPTAATYAKYYGTMGRLYALENNYEEAKKSIRHAIDLEDSSAKDYVLRVSNYQLLLHEIQLKERLGKSLGDLNQKQTESERKIENQTSKTEDTIKALQQESHEKIAEMNEKFSEIKTENLKILGFFTAILTLTIGSVQIISAQGFREAALLIVILMGGLLVVYAGFTLMLNSVRLSIPIAIIGIIIVIATIMTYITYLQ